MRTTDPTAPTISLGGSYLSPDELDEVGFAAVGENVKISRDARIYGVERVSIGSHVRIDDFTIITAMWEPVMIGSYVHVHSYVGIYGAGGVELADFSAVSGKTSIYTGSDDYSGSVLTNPTVPDEYKNVTVKPFRLGRHAIIGAGAVILPGASIGDGAAVGAMSLVTKTVPDWMIVTGIPARILRERSRDLLKLEARLIASRPA